MVLWTAACGALWLKYRTFIIGRPGNANVPSTQNACFTLGIIVQQSFSLLLRDSMNSGLPKKNQFRSSLIKHRARKSRAKKPNQHGTIRLYCRGQ
jgi:hypothetical protein